MDFPACNRGWGNNTQISASKAHGRGREEQNGRKRLSTGREEWLQKRRDVEEKWARSKGERRERETWEK